VPASYGSLNAHSDNRTTESHKMTRGLVLSQILIHHSITRLGRDYWFPFNISFLIHHLYFSSGALNNLILQPLHHIFNAEEAKKVGRTGRSERSASAG